MVVEGFHGTSGNAVLGILASGTLLPNGGQVFLSETLHETFAHGADLERRAAFSIEVRVETANAMVERVSTPGCPRTVILRTDTPQAVEIIRLHVRTRREGGWHVFSIDRDKIEEFVKGERR